ncbi:MAG: phosphoglycolate phosphatase [Magnetococcales bacterium]|nr:phosphoglycolate phosphatase [Magnetococcales bacterium]
MTPTTPPLPCQAVLFDLDGTLVETAVDLAGAMNHVLAKRGYPTLPLAQVRNMVGHGARVLLARGFWGFGAQPPDGDPDFEAAVRDFLDYYGDHLVDGSRPFPGVEDTLDQLLDQGYKLAVVTNKPEHLTLKMLKLLDLDRRFQAVVGGDTLSRRKPDPHPLWHALDALGVPAAAAVMVGDSETDVASGRAAGCAVVAVTYGYNRDQPVRELNPDRITDHFAELPTLLVHPAGANRNSP